MTKISLYLKIRQQGFGNVIALMGSSIKGKHIELLIRTLGPTGRLTLILDSGKSEAKMVLKGIDKLMENVFVKIISLKEGDSKPGIFPR